MIRILVNDKILVANTQSNLVKIYVMINRKVDNILDNIHTDQVTRLE